MQVKVVVSSLREKNNAVWQPDIKQTFNKRRRKM